MYKIKLIHVLYKFGMNIAVVEKEKFKVNMDEPHQRVHSPWVLPAAVLRMLRGSSIHTKEQDR